jgi:hypothetical protein
VRGLSKGNAGITVRSTKDGLIIELKGEPYARIGRKVENGELRGFFRLLKKFVKEICDLE